MSGVAALTLTIGLVVANAVFVAAEFAVVSVRRAELEELAATGSARARLVLAARERLSFVLSAAQFGITASSLLLGFVAERAVGDSLLRPAAEAVGLPAEAGSVAIVVAAILVSTVFQMIVGELAPKNLAIARPLSVSMAVILPMRAFETVFGPIIRLFDTAAAWTSKVLFRLDPSDGGQEAHTLEELALIIDESGRHGSLSSEQADLLAGALRLRATRVREVMVAWPDVRSLPADATVRQLRAVAAASGFSRFPVVGDDGVVTGTIHVKDLLGAAGVGEDDPIAPLVGDTTEVAEWATVQQLLSMLKRDQRTFALVIDEFGDVTGIATVEDVLEQLVGDIADEFDRPRPQLRRRDDGTLEVAGSFRMSRLAELLETDLVEGEYVTLAGFILDQLGRIPEVGDAVTTGDHRFEVAEMRGPRVGRIVVLPVSATGSDPSEDAS